MNYLEIYPHENGWLVMEFASNGDSAQEIGVFKTRRQATAVARFLSEATGWEVIQ